jgi:hypothetical protein
LLYKLAKNHIPSPSMTIPGDGGSKSNINPSDTSVVCRPARLNACATV